MGNKNIKKEEKKKKKVDTKTVTTFTAREVVPQPELIKKPKKKF